VKKSRFDRKSQNRWREEPPADEIGAAHSARRRYGREIARPKRRGATEDVDVRTRTSFGVYDLIRMSHIFRTEPSVCWCGISHLTSRGEIDICPPLAVSQRTPWTPPKNREHNERREDGNHNKHRAAYDNSIEPKHYPKYTTIILIQYSRTL
jgi:hypothetical protein